MHPAGGGGHCRYRSPARYDDEILIETRPAMLRGSVLKFAYRILRKAHEGEGTRAPGRGRDGTRGLRRPVETQGAAGKICARAAGNDGGREGGTAQ